MASTRLQTTIRRIVKLKVLISLQLLMERTAISRIVAETRAGRFELLPRRLDCIAALAPGILRYETPTAGAAYLAVGEGVLIKAGALVLVSVDHAIGDLELAERQGAAAAGLSPLDQQERNVRAAFARAESSLLRRLAEFQRER